MDVQSHFDHLKIQEYEDPFPILAEARQGCPVTRSDEHGGFLALFRYADIVTVARNPQVFCSRQGVTIPSHVPFPMLPPLECDPPLHMQFRAPLLERFSAAGVAIYEPVIRAMVTELLDAFIETGTADFARDLAMPLPTNVIAHVLEMPDADRDKFRDWSVRVILNAEDCEALAELMQYFYGTYTDRRQAPRDDIATLILQMQIDNRPITDIEFLCMMNMLAIAGLETTASAAANILEILGKQPDLRRQVVAANPAELDLAVEELLRYVTPLPSLARTVTEPTEFQGAALAPGDKVLMNWIAANHDPEEFPDPEQIDFARQPNRHVAFGVGIHRCLGAHLARLELRVLLEEVAARIPDFRVIEEQVVRYGGFITRGIATLPVEFPAGRRLARRMS